MATFLFNITMMKLVGEDGVAAITVIIYSGFLLTSIYIGFSVGVAPVISYNYGAGNITQLKKVLHICFCFIISIQFPYFCFLYLMGKILQNYLQQIIKMFMRLLKQDLQYIHLAFCFLDTIFLLLLYLRHYLMENYQQ